MYARLRKKIQKKKKQIFSIEDSTATGNRVSIQKFDKEFDAYVDVDQVDDLSGGDKQPVPVESKTTEPKILDNQVAVNYWKSC